MDDLERDLNGIDVVVDLDNRVAFGSTVRVGRGEVVNDLVSIGGDVKVDGEVRGDAVSIGGEAKINGRVTGEVVSIGGDIELGPRGGGVRRTSSRSEANWCARRGPPSSARFPRSIGVNSTGI